jgi:uncharacterized protein (DUF427 family)
MQRIEPAPSQESVWDYPRPPRIEPSARRVRVIFNGETIADSTRAVRVLETSHPPVWYIPRDDVRADLLTRTELQTVCEWKGAATYWTLRVGDRVSENAAWSYERPVPAFELSTGYLAFYPRRVDACYVDHELVQPQEGDFYGGWITSEIVGPYKGGQGVGG